MYNLCILHSLEDEDPSSYFVLIHGSAGPLGIETPNQKPKIMFARKLGRIFSKLSQDPWNWMIYRFHVLDE
jgi:hypothetical protein